MIVVRQWMTNSFKATVAYKKVALALTFLTLASCNPTEITSSGQRAASYGGNVVNKAYIYRESPAITHGLNYGPNVSMTSSVDTSLPEFITDKTQLKGDCTFFEGGATLDDCIHTYASKSASQQLLPRKAEGNWCFPANSFEFYQVNAHYHVQHGISTFYDKLKFTYETLHMNPTLPFMFQAKSTPSYLPQTGMYWFKAITPSNDNYFRNSFMSTYALCNLELNAESVTAISIATPAGMAIIGFIKHDKKLQQDALFTGVAFLASSIVTRATKAIVKRQRPFEKYSFIIKRDDEAGGMSFPSGHTSSAFCSATSLALRYRKWYVIAPAYIFAASVGWARMYQGVHYPSDVVAGALVGAASAWLGYKAQKWIARKKDQKKKVTL